MSFAQPTQNPKPPQRPDKSLAFESNGSNKSWSGFGVEAFPGTGTTCQDCLCCGLEYCTIQSHIAYDTASTTVIAAAAVAAAFFPSPASPPRPPPPPLPPPPLSGTTTSTALTNSIKSSSNQRKPHVSTTRSSSMQSERPLLAPKLGEPDLAR